MADEMKPPAPDGAPAPAAPPTEFPLDLSRLNEAYANFCRVIPLPEEIVLETKPEITPESPISGGLFAPDLSTGVAVANAIWLSLPPFLSSLT